MAGDGRLIRSAFHRLPHLGALFAAGLEKRGILVRHYSDARLADHMRITVGRPEQTDLLLAALRDIGSQGGF